MTLTSLFITSSLFSSLAHHSPSICILVYLSDVIFSFIHPLRLFSSTYTYSFFPCQIIRYSLRASIGKKWIRERMRMVKYESELEIYYEISHLSSHSQTSLESIVRVYSCCIIVYCVPRRWTQSLYPNVSFQWCGVRSWAPNTARSNWVHNCAVRIRCSSFCRVNGTFRN